MKTFSVKVLPFDSSVDFPSKLFSVLRANDIFDSHSETPKVLQVIGEKFGTGTQKLTTRAWSIQFIYTMRERVLCAPNRGFIEHSL